MDSKFDKSSLLFRHRQLAPSASVRVSPLCLGAMTFGESHSERYGKCNKDTAFDILDYFYKKGGNFIDTASVYRNGDSEQWLGDWMASRGNRDEMVLATKYTGGYQSHRDVIHSNYIGTGSKCMKLSLEASLEKLQTTYIDLFYVHWWDYTTQIPELMQSLNDLVTSGKVIYLGISDAPAWIVTLANEYARSHGLRQFTVYQGFWNAGVRDMERDIIPMCQHQGMGILPYGVLGQGRFQTEQGYKEREKGHDGRTMVPLTEHDKKVSKVLEEVADAKGVELLHVALAYVLQRVPYVFPIVGQRTVKHLESSVNALSVSLTEEEIKKVESAYSFEYGFPHTLLTLTILNNGSEPHRRAWGPEDVALIKLQCPDQEFDWVKGPSPLGPPKDN